MTWRGTLVAGAASCALIVRSPDIESRVWATVVL
jgi:hypothetical protein